MLHRKWNERPGLRPIEVYSLDQFDKCRVQVRWLGCICPEFVRLVRLTCPPWFWRLCNRGPFANFNRFLVSDHFLSQLPSFLSEGSRRLENERPVGQQICRPSSNACNCSLADCTLLPGFRKPERSLLSRRDQRPVLVVFLILGLLEETTASHAGWLNERIVAVCSAGLVAGPGVGLGKGD